MIVDCFLYRDEPECLEIRLHELSPYVELFVLVESDTTFQGNPKPLLYDPARYEGFPIRHVVVDDMSDTDDPWERETHQRNAILRGLDGVPDDAVALIGDVDEIPRQESLPKPVQLIRESVHQISLEQVLCFYKFDLWCTSLPWYGTQVLTVGRMRQNSPQDARVNRSGNLIKSKAGWHFTNLGDPDWIIDKIEAFSHSEVNLPKYKDPVLLQRCIDEGREMTGRTDLTFEVDESGDLPEWLLENRDRFAHLFAKAKVKA